MKLKNRILITLSSFSILLGSVLCNSSYSYTPEPKVMIVESNQLDLSSGLNELTDKIIYQISEGNKKVIILDFTNIDGKVADIGRYIAEEITTRLFETKKLTVIERTLIKQILSEHDFSKTGFVDPTQATKIGKILGVDTIVSGTVADYGNHKIRKIQQ